LRRRGKGSKLGAFPKERLGTFPKEIFCLKCAEIYCCEGGRTVRIRTVRTTRKRACFSRQIVGTKIEVVWSVSCCRKGYVQSVRTTVVWHMFFEVLFSGWVVQQYGFGTVFLGRFLWDCLGVVSGFLLL
jgi:hypothetical protein